jgi:hypothetical protein
MRAHSYVDRGFYSRQITHLLRHFSREHLLVIRTDHLLTRHVETLQHVYRFLDVVSPAPFPEPQQVRPALGSGILDRRVEPSFLVQAFLKRIYKNEIERLEQLLGWNLADWK